MIDIPIYDWPPSVMPSDQLFRVPGQAKQGGFTTGGARIMSPETGGRAMIEWTFGTQKEAGEAARLYSWLISKVSNGNVFRLPIWNSRQLVRPSDVGLSLPDGFDSHGVPWDDDIYWDNDAGWAFEIGAATTAVALEGTSTVIIDFGALLPGLGHGHVIGIADRAHLVDDIEYDGPVATVTITPPLRADVAVGDFVTFRPVMYGVCVDPESFKALFDRGMWIRPGSITFAEAIL